MRLLQIKRLGSVCNGIGFFGQDCKPYGIRSGWLKYLYSRKVGGGEYGKFRPGLQMLESFRGCEESGLFKKDPLLDTGSPVMTAPCISECPETRVGSWQGKWRGRSEQWDSTCRGKGSGRSNARSQPVIGPWPQADADCIGKAAGSDSRLESLEEG